MLFIIVFCVSFPSIVLSQSPSFNFQKLDLSPTSTGPESITFDPLGRGPYTGISDGRIVKYVESNFLEVYTTSPNRTNSLCDGTNNPALLGPTCGRPLGLGFYFRENILYIADAYRGLLVVRARERLATPLATEAEGVPFKCLDGLDVDQENGDVYFTDASARFSFSQIQEAVVANDATGRLLKYDRRTQQVIVLQRGLAGASGVAISSDGSFVLVTEYIANRIKKFWLRGPKAFTPPEVIVTFQGRPDNIKRTIFGEFWVAVNIQSQGGQIVPTAIRITGNGNVLQTLPLDKYYYNTTISEFQQRGLKYYIGSLDTSFLGLLY